MGHLWSVPANFWTWWQIREENLVSCFSFQKLSPSYIFCTREWVISCLGRAFCNDHPTTNGGMQNGSSGGMHARCIHVLARFGTDLHAQSVLSSKKFRHRSSVGSLLRVHCWLGMLFANLPTLYRSFTVALHFVPNQQGCDAKWKLGRRCWSSGNLQGH